MKIHSVFLINLSILISCFPIFTQNNPPIEGLQNIENARVYLVGERHDIIEKFDYQVQLIKHLHQYKNVDVIILEHSNSNVFAQFGTQHVRKNDATSMAYYLNNDTTSLAFQSVFSLRLTFREIENLPEYYKKKDDCPSTNKNICDTLFDIKIDTPKVIYLKDFPQLNEQFNGLLFCPKGSWGNVLR